jgi:hypothetical protein
MVQILLVRSMAEIQVATDEASRFLVYRRQLSQRNQDDEVLAIWVKRNLDGGLPDCLRAEDRIGLLESVSLSGIWSLCRIDGPALRRAHSSGERRDEILRTLVQPELSSRASAEPAVFFPVFEPTKSVETIEAEIHSLRAKYPQLVAAQWYRDDNERGIVSAE